MAGPSITKQRQAEALQLLLGGHGTAAAVSELAGRWGLSRRQARRYVSAAAAELVEELGEVDRTALMAQLIVKLEDLAQRATAAEQYTAAVGALRSLAVLCQVSGVPPAERRGWPTFSSRKWL